MDFGDLDNQQNNQNDSKFSLDLENDSLRLDDNANNDNFMHELDQVQDQSGEQEPAAVILDEPKEDDSEDDPLNMAIDASQ